MTSPFGPSRSMRDLFTESLNKLQKHCHWYAVSQGFWDEKEIGIVEADAEAERPYRIKAKPWNFGEKIALIHSELSEALEKHRCTVGKGLPEQPDEHCPEFSGIAIEFADTIIRVLDLAEKMGYDMAEAILAKMTFNETRPPKHGKAY